MTLSLGDFWQLGREQRFARRNPATRLFTFLFGPIGLHSRIRAGHVLLEIQGLPLPPAARVLDAGCGHGLVLFALANRRPQYRLHGMELNPEQVAANQMIATRLKRDGLTFEPEDLAKAAALGGPYDLIFSIDVLEHIHEDEHVLRLMRQSLAPGGWLVLHLPRRHQLQRRIFPVFKRHVMADHVRDEYTEDELRAKLAAAGFDLAELKYGFGWSGELAFELNALFWNTRWARGLAALLTYPLGWCLSFADINTAWPTGNALIVIARPGTNRSSEAG